MEVVFSPEAEKFVKERGGAVFVQATNQRCCGGALVVLNARTSPPRDVRGFVPYPAGAVELFYRGNPRGLPDQLVIELKGVFRRRLAAFKDGCVFPL